MGGEGEGVNTPNNHDNDCMKRKTKRKSDRGGDSKQTQKEAGKGVEGSDAPLPICPLIFLFFVKSKKKRIDLRFQKQKKRQWRRGEGGKCRGASPQHWY